MSLSITLIPLAITVVMLAKQAGEDITEKIAESQKQGVPCKINTIYKDSNLLYKTLHEHGMKVAVVNDNCIRATCSESSLLFERHDSSQAFHLKLSSSDEINALKSELDELDEEYGMNVQSFTYHHVKDNLEDGMSVESEEILDDNSILLTINLN